MVRGVLFVLSACGLWLVHATSSTLELPSFAGTILEKQFPEPKTSDLSDLRRYRQDLEGFREFVLEGYNRGLIEYSRKVDSTSNDLEERRRTGRIDPVTYEKMHQHLKEEMSRLSSDGEYMRVYRLNMARYKRQARWVVGEITRKERHQLQF